MRDAADTRPGTGEESETPSPVLNARPVVEEVVVAIYKHDVEENDELPFDTGDEILVLSKDGSGWWQGRNKKTGATGIFPAVYRGRVINCLLIQGINDLLSQSEG